MCNTEISERCLLTRSLFSWLFNWKTGTVLFASRQAALKGGGEEELLLMYYTGM